MTSEEIVSSDPDILGGALAFTGTRVPVKSFVDYLCASNTLEVFLRDFPTVSREQAVGYLQMSADLIELEYDARRREDDLRRAREAGRRIITVSEENVARLLVNRNAEIHVREPEDFESPDGVGLLRGATTAYKPATVQSYQAFELTVTPFLDEDGAQIDKLTATSLYTNVAGLVSPMAVGDPVYVRLDGSGGSNVRLVGKMQVRLGELEQLVKEQWEK